MFALVTYIVVVGTVLGFAGLALAVALGRTPDTTQPAKLWYPAGPDPVESSARPAGLAR